MFPENDKSLAPESDSLVSLVPRIGIIYVQEGKPTESEMQAFVKSMAGILPSGLALVLTKNFHLP